MGEAATQKTGTQAVERALALLTELERDEEPVTLTDLAERTGLSPSTAHRLVRALCDEGLVRQDPATERYGLGMRLVVLGQRATSSLGLDAARAVLQRLSDETDESVNLGVRDGDDVRVVLCVPSSQPLRFFQDAGTRVPLYASAMGKVLMAFDPDRDATIGHLPRLAALTGTTITSRRALRLALETIRAQGWALNDEERNAGVRTVSAPVLSGSGIARAAIAVQGPSVRMTDDRLPTLVAAARRAATEVGVSLTVGV